MNMLSEAKGLMAFWADIDADYLLRYQEWHTCEHVPERVSIPGFLRGRRYRVADGSPHFLMMYETRTPDVLASDAYLAALNAPTDWTREALTHFRNPSRNIYRQVATAGIEGAFAAPWLTSLRFNRPGNLDGSKWVSAIADRHGILRAQLWEVDEQVSGIQTSERKIYGGGPGEQQYLLLVEAETPGGCGSDALDFADALMPEVAERRNQILGSYWLEAHHNAPTTQETR